MSAAEKTEKEFQGIFNSMSGKVYKYALKFTRNAELAEEIVQEVFIKLWLQRESLSEIENFPGYVYIATRNQSFTVLSEIARDVKGRALMAESVYENRSGGAEEFSFHKAEEIYEQALNSLSPQQRKVFALCELEGVNYEEAAQLLSLTKHTVKRRKHQALAAMRKYTTAAMN